MKKIKIASLWNATVNLKASLIVNLIKVISNRDIEFTEVKNCDLLIFGPYEHQSVISIAKRRLVNKILRNKKLRNNYPNLDIYLLNRNYNPIKIFLSFENYKLPEDYDVKIVVKEIICDSIDITKKEIELLKDRNCSIFITIPEKNIEKLECSIVDIDIDDNILVTLKNNTHTSTIYKFPIDKISHYNMKYYILYIVFNNLPSSYNKS